MFLKYRNVARGTNGETVPYGMILPNALLVAVGVQVSCQLFKFAFYSVRDRRLEPRYLVTAGGIPSAHAAFVSALSAAIGMHAGFDSDLFAVAAVFSAIVIYDAYRLRGHVQHHAKLLNELVLRPAGREPVSEMIGHSVPELIVGVIYGSGIAVLASAIWW
jgi:acid phosphatase family membrane protein YuiD